MKYYGQETDLSKLSDRVGVILINLGTPEHATWLGLRQYLSEFLMDPRVIEMPWLLRLILVKGLIINFRSHKSAKIYQKIWTHAGSPLLTNCQGLTERAATALGDGFQVTLAMRYGKPSIEQAFEELHKSGIRRLVVIPLYPQYSGSTSGSTFDAISQTLGRFRWIPKLSFIGSYYQQSSYVDAIATSIQKHWQNHGKAKKLIISFHGVPQKLITNGDPYLDHCKSTATAVTQELGLTDDQWVLVFQSRFGAEKWLQPYCDETLRSLPPQGIKSVDIVCPGFSADCLETLYEIEIENREYFINAGGEHYSYIPCLNDSSSHAELIAELVRNET